MTYGVLRVKAHGHLGVQGMVISRERSEVTLPGTVLLGFGPSSLPSSAFAS